MRLRLCYYLLLLTRARQTIVCRTDAERSVVAFASLLFIAYAVFTAELVMFKDTVIADDGGDPGLVEAGGNGTGAARFSATAGVSGGATGAPVSAEHDDRL